jgi:multidrug efflux pump subunit AcrA (membrane-fusion protein)
MQITEDATELVIVDDTQVSASAKVVAANYANLSFMVSAQELILYVKPGDEVKDGDRLAMIPEDALPQIIILAESDLVSAKRVLSDLLKSEKPKFLAEQAKIQAEIAVDKAKDQLANIKSTRASDNIIQKTRAQLDLAREDLADAEEAYEKVEDNDDGDVLKAQATITLTDARTRVNDLTRQLNWYLEGAEPLDIQEKEAALSVAEANLADAIREYERLKEGPDPDEVLAAEARVKAAESVIDQKYLIAPFDGTIIEVNAQTGEAVSPGVPVILLADLETLVVQTTDLSEVDIARVEIGDPVRVTFDSLENTIIPGKVSEIALKNATGSGVYYTVTITLDETPKELRWGMSAFVEIMTE